MSFEEYKSAVEAAINRECPDNSIKLDNFESHVRDGFDHSIEPSEVAKSVIWLDDYLQDQERERDLYADMLAQNYDAEYGDVRY